MYTRRVFNKDNMAKIDGLLAFLFSNNKKYCVSYYPDDAIPNEYKAIVSWNE